MLIWTFEVASAEHHDSLPLNNSESESFKKEAIPKLDAMGANAETSDGKISLTMQSRELAYFSSVNLTSNCLLF